MFRFAPGFLATTCFLILAGTRLWSQPCREIIAYYPAWQWYDRDKLVKPASIDYSLYSIINYAFFRPQPDGSIQGTDAYADEILLKGEINWSTTPPSYYPNTSLIDLAHNQNVRVLLSIGGWNDSQHFPAIAADPVKRGNFAHHCGLLLMEYDLDGIDIDWEYPGYAPNGGTPADKVNFSLLIAQVRDTLDARESQAGHALYLTSCFSANAANMDNIEWPQVLPDLHSVNLMSYDFFGSWDPITNHNAPLYAPAQGDPDFNLDFAVQQLLQVHQVPASKINAGVAFYGRAVKTQGPPALFGPSLMQPDQSTFWEDAGSPLYYNILAKMNLFSLMTDPQARVSYLLGNGSLNTFVSYDDEASIAEKAAYIVANGLRGAIIWELTGDYLETSPGSGLVAGTPLADTLNAVFCTTTSVKPYTETGTTEPFRLLGQCLVPADRSRPWSLLMYGSDGRLAHSRHCSGTLHLGDLNLKEGLYLLSLRQGSHYQTLKWVKMR